MPWAQPKSILATLGVAVLLGGCSSATDSDDRIYVTITSPSPVLLRGDQTELVARLWVRNSATDSVEVRNAELLWSSADPLYASVSTEVNGVGLVTGVRPGLVDIRVVAPGFERADPAVYSIRIANPLEIDSVRPAVVRYGEKVTLFGVGVSQLFVASLGAAVIFPDTFSIVGDPAGLSQMSFWVPHPAKSDRILVLSPGQLVVAPESTLVIPVDLYEPNETSPTQIDLDGPRPFPAIPAVRLFNPALAFEEVDRDSIGLEWYRLSTAGASALTFILTAPTFSGFHQTYLSAPTANARDTLASEWTLGSGTYRCKGYSFSAKEQPADSLIVALAKVPAGTVDLISHYFVSGRYGLAVLEGYLTADPNVLPDRYEENDICNYADDNFLNPATRIDLTTAFSDTLTIDNPHDIDWLRFRVPGVLPQLVTIQSASRMAKVSPLPDTTDIDLYLLRVPGGSFGLDPFTPARNPGSTESISVILDPGDYYLVVTDFAGAPTGYSLCMAVGTTCSLLPAPPASARIAPQRASSVRSATRPRKPLHSAPSTQHSTPFFGVRR